MLSPPSWSRQLWKYIYHPKVDLDLDTAPTPISLGLSWPLIHILGVESTNVQLVEHCKMMCFGFWCYQLDAVGSSIVRCNFTGLAPIRTKSQVSTIMVFDLFQLNHYLIILTGLARDISTVSAKALVSKSKTPWLVVPRKQSRMHQVGRSILQVALLWKQFSRTASSCVKCWISVFLHAVNAWPVDQHRKTVQALSFSKGMASAFAEMLWMFHPSTKKGPLKTSIQPPENAPTFRIAQALEIATQHLRSTGPSDDLWEGVEPFAIGI